MPKQKYYVVWKGRKKGVFASWAECEAQVKGFVGAQFKAFETKAEADQAFKANYENYKGKPASSGKWKHAENPPHVAVLDNMLRWANPAADMPLPPAEVTSSSEAGLRCANRLLSDHRTRDVKVLLYSLLAKDDLGERPPEAADCLIKELDFENLIEKIMQVLGHLTPQLRESLQKQPDA